MPPPFDWIIPDLAIGGRFDPLTASELRALGVGAVIDLRDEACDDCAALEAADHWFLHLPTQDHAAVSEQMLESGVAFAARARAAERRLLIHCQHGIGRSALLALCVLVSWGWAPQPALAQAKDARACISPSPAQYHAWAAWLHHWKQEHPVTWTIPDFDSFAAVAYRHLARG